jgi:hypothetical protein
LLIKRKVKKSEAKNLSTGLKHMELVKRCTLPNYALSMHSSHCHMYGATATFAGLLLPFLSDPNIELK